MSLQVSKCFEISVTYSSFILSAPSEWTGESNVLNSVYFGTSVPLNVLKNIVIVNCVTINGNCFYNRTSV